MDNNIHRQIWAFSSNKAQDLGLSMEDLRDEIEDLGLNPIEFISQAIVEHRKKKSKLLQPFFDSHLQDVRWEMELTSEQRLDIDIFANIDNDQDLKDELGRVAKKLSLDIEYIDVRHDWCHVTQVQINGDNIRGLFEAFFYHDQGTDALLERYYSKS